LVSCSKNNDATPNPPDPQSKGLDAMAEEKDPVILKRDRIWKKFYENGLRLKNSPDSNGGGFILSRSAETHECKLYQMNFVCDPAAEHRNKTKIKKLYEVCIPLNISYKDAMKFIKSASQQVQEDVLSSLSEFGSCEYEKPLPSEPTVIEEPACRRSSKSDTFRSFRWGWILNVKHSITKIFNS